MKGIDGNIVHSQTFVGPIFFQVIHVVLGHVFLIFLRHELPFLGQFGCDLRCLETWLGGIECYDKQLVDANKQFVGHTIIAFFEFTTQVGIPVISASPLALCACVL